MRHSYSGNPAPTTYWDASAHDVPYPEFACQVMMLLAQEIFLKREMVLRQEHEGRTCTTGRSTESTLKTKSHRSSADLIFPSFLMRFISVSHPKFEKHCSACNANQRPSQRKIPLSRTRRAFLGRRIQPVALAERFRNACIHESFTECRVTPLLPDTVICPNHA